MRLRKSSRREKKTDRTAAVVGIVALLALLLAGTIMAFASRRAREGD